MNSASLYHGVVHGQLRCTATGTDYIQVHTPDGAIWDIIALPASGRWMVVAPPTGGEPSREDTAAYSAWVSQLPRFISVDVALRYIERKVSE